MKDLPSLLRDSLLCYRESRFSEGMYHVCAALRSTFVVHADGDWDQCHEMVKQFLQDNTDIVAYATFLKMSGVDVCCQRFPSAWSDGNVLFSDILIAIVGAFWKGNIDHRTRFSLSHTSWFQSESGMILYPSTIIVGMVAAIVANYKSTDPCNRDLGGVTLYGVPLSDFWGRAPELRARCSL